MTDNVFYNAYQFLYGEERTDKIWEQCLQKFGVTQEEWEKEFDRRLDIRLKEFRENRGNND